MSARQIKKYANRRLYDTTDSRYITTGDIQAMLAAGDVVSIIDARSSNDITRAVLLNMLADAELNGKSPILSQYMLSEMLRYDDDMLAGFLGNYLEQCLQVFIENQDIIHECMHDFDRTSPYELLAHMVQAQQQLFDKV